MANKKGGTNEPPRARCRNGGLMKGEWLTNRPCTAARAEPIACSRGRPRLVQTSSQHPVSTQKQRTLILK